MSEQQLLGLLSELRESRPQPSRSSNQYRSTTTHPPHYQHRKGSSSRGGRSGGGGHNKRSAGNNTSTFRSGKCHPPAPPVSIGVPFNPALPYVDPRPFAPLTTLTISEEWTCPVVETFHRTSARIRNLAVSFRHRAARMNAWNTLIIIIVALSQCGIIALVFTEPDERDWIVALIAALALFLVLVNQSFQFQNKAQAFDNASVQLNVLSRNINNYLMKPFDQRVSPFDLSVGVERTVADIINIAYGRPVELHSDIFTPNPYD